MASTEKVIAVLGAGSWGTALAMLLANNQQPVRLWGHDAEHMKEIKIAHCNQRYLPGFSLPHNITLFTDLFSAIKDVEDILIVVPSHAFRPLLLTLKPMLSPKTRLIWGTKGMDTTTHHLLDEVTRELLGKQRPIAVLSGPSFALDVAAGLPAAVTIAASNKTFAKLLANRFNTPTFRIYTTQDITGVEICGVIKNILAIAAGISDGLKLGASALSALITRGLAEMQRLGLALGAKPETFLGLAGVGDLILTCTDDKSRNRRFGKAIAQGKTKDQAIQEIGQVVEGIHNLKAIHDLLQEVHVSMPITEQVYQVLYENLPPKKAVQNLFAREIKEEGI